MATLQENVAKVVAAHSAIKAALEGQGVTVPEGAKLSDMASLVEAIPVDTATPVPDVSFYGGKLSGDVVLPPAVKCDLAAATNLRGIFIGCTEITSLTLPDGYGVSATDFSLIFSNCNKLVSLTLPDGFGAAATLTRSCFGGCAALQNVTGAIKFPISFVLSGSSLLTHDSIMNILNGLVTVSTDQTLTLGSTNLAKLTDEEKAIATAKGWTLA